MIRRTLAAVALLGTAACGSSEPAQQTPVKTTSEVAYFVTGSVHSASITKSTPTGNEQGSAAVPLMNQSGTEGLHYKFRSGQFVYISAQNSQRYGDITCRIEVDGVAVSENTSNGAFGIATCKGQA